MPEVISGNCLGLSYRGVPYLAAPPFDLIPSSLTHADSSPPGCQQRTRQLPAGAFGPPRRHGSDELATFDPSGPGQGSAYVREGLRAADSQNQNTFSYEKRGRLSDE